MIRDVADVVGHPASPGREPIRVLVVDDQQLFRRGLTMLLAVEPGLEVVGEAGDGVEGTQLAETAAPRMWLSVYVAVMGVITLTAVYIASETRHRDIS